jgi:hypothetical protein
MGRKRTQNYREMRTDFEEEEGPADEEEGDEEEDEDEEGEEEEEEGAEGAEGEPAEEGEEGEEDEAPKKKKPKPKPKAVKPKRTRAAKVTRMRVVWGVFNNSHQMVASYEFPKRSDADAHAARLMAEKKTTHFVNPVKEAIDEKKEK